MSVLRLENWLGQQRVDVPHLRGIDSGVLADFDLLAGTMLVNRTPFVLQGFNLIPLTAGVAATNLQISVAGSALFHPTATEVGTIFSTAVGRTVETLNATNARVVGGFTASTVNYIGVDLRRSADSTTSDLVQFLGATTLTESPQTVPLGRTLDYVIVIGTQDFSTTPTIAPLCKVTTDANNNIVTLEDARNMFGRLGKGGSVTNTGYTYPWPGGRTEVGNNSDFGAGDKAIPSLKDWMDAAMTRIWEVGGGERWYSAAMPHNVWMVRNGTVLFTNSDFFEWDGTHLHWREIRFTFSNSTGYFNDVADQLSNSTGLTDLADGQCIYADLDRTQNRTGGSAIVALKGTTATLGTPLVPGSRYILAWRSGTSVYARGNPYAIGTTFNPATTTTIGMVKLSVVSATPTAPVCFNPDVNNALTVSANAGGAAGVTASGNGSGAGISGTGGATNGIGVAGNGTGTGAGVVGQGGGGGGAGVTATATGGNGNGVVATGFGNGSGIDATGGATGIGIVVHAVSAASVKPTQLIQDAAGNNRYVWDHNGLPTGGRVCRFEDDWLVAPGASASVWSTALGAAAAIAVQDPTGAFNAPFLLFTPSSTGSATAYSLAFTQRIVQASTGTAANALSLVIEFEVGMNAASAGTASKVSWFFGLDAGSDPGGADLSLIGLYKKHNAVDWKFLTGNGTIQVTTASSPSTNPTSSNNPVDRVRIEVQGSTAPLGAYQARFYVNEVFIGSVASGNLPGAAGLRLLFGSFNEGAGAPVGAPTATVGPIVAVWNRFLSGPAL